MVTEAPNIFSFRKVLIFKTKPAKKKAQRFTSTEGQAERNTVNTAAQGVPELLQDASSSRRVSREDAGI